ncbi:rhodanese-like domain-containing protein [Nakamurella sp. YIM 132087]|uniref:Rhodanese-like domain-containing protein n=1 Tax=Nakamurella alba TaxID=2665158 RepID=A0A7K1FQV8_9ACTN|nr:rhodanese-like domain-containing protein [Nakamurella alba]MTD15633.1 rhodanese-like domain-containing protein [Nakamurella alba]
MPSQVPEVGIDQVPADAVLLDVRESDEWEAGHAPGAVHIPMTTLTGRLGEVPEAAPLYVICRSGGRSARVTEFLNANGWESVNVAGGMMEWARAGRPLEGAGSGGAPEII